MGGAASAALTGCRWLSSQVEPWDPANLDRDCLGGKQSEGPLAEPRLLPQVPHSL